MTRPIAVVVNRQGGSAAALGEALHSTVAAAFAQAGNAIDLAIVDGNEVRAAVRARTGASIIVVGGGDGTLGCAADVVAGTDMALGILPLGTRNHLARELGVPLDLPGAARLIGQASIRTIDLARANGQAFVNNASIGLYPSLVRFRKAERERHPMPKWLAALPASFAALKRIRHHRLRLMLPGSSEEIVTPMLFVGNNRYTLEPGRIGQRAALDDGKLSVVAVASRRRLALIGLALRTLAGRSDPDRDFAAIGDYRWLTIEGLSRDVDIAIDGEVRRMTMPIRFVSEPGALRVVAPIASNA